MAWRTAAAVLWKRLAKDFGVTRERIRQIEAKALRKLRHRPQQKAEGLLGIIVDKQL